MRYLWQSRAGLFVIEQRAGRWHPVFDGESLGSYATPQQALDDLRGGHTFSLSGGIDSSRLGLPEDLSEWITGK
jgi:hypothetical protein